MICMLAAWKIHSKCKTKYPWESLDIVNCELLMIVGLLRLGPSLDSARGLGRPKNTTRTPVNYMLKRQLGRLSLRGAHICVFQLSRLDYSVVSCYSHLDWRYHYI